MDQTIPRIVESDGEPPKDIETDFANHDCAKSLEVMDYERQLATMRAEHIMCHLNALKNRTPPLWITLSRRWAVE